jgi:hypothetical protein
MLHVGSASIARFSIVAKNQHGNGKSKAADSFAGRFLLRRASLREDLQHDLELRAPSRGHHRSAYRWCKFKHLNCR